jgi:hypothetical protein
MATCARCHGHLTRDHVCPRRPGEAAGRAGDFFLGAVLGGAVGVIIFGMLGEAIFGRAHDTTGLVAGSLVGITLVRTTRRLQIR